MKIIGLTGLKKSGKDEVFKCIKELLPELYVVRFGFADALKEELAAACGVSVDFIDKDKDTFRTALQWWGTDFRRKIYGKDYWISKLNHSLIKCNDPINLAVIPDVRFFNEAQFIHALGFPVIRVDRGLADTDLHQSEVEQKTIPCEYTILNTGTIENLYSATKTILTYLGYYDIRTNTGTVENSHIADSGTMRERIEGAIEGTVG